MDDVPSQRIVQTHSSGDCESQLKQAPGRKGLWQKLRAAYRESHHDPISSGYSQLLSVAYFWFISVSGLYLMLSYNIPEGYADWDPTNRYYLKVASCFVFLQITANFLCVRFFDSFRRKTADRPRQTAEQQHYARLNHCGVRLKGRDVLSNSQRHCDVCDVSMPYRSHHCIICRKCVLKRDHHCYFTGACIGHFNQRFFVVMNFYIAVACAWGMFDLVHYLRHVHQPRDGWDYVLPVTCFRWLEGDVTTRDMLVTWHAYGIWWIGFTAISAFVWNVFIILLGKTSHEIRTGVKVRSMATVSGRIRSVFGDFWAANLLFPAVLIFRQDSDGVFWPDLKVTIPRCTISS